jgi:alpha-ketoglutarate-dependent taurine dioxygenase
MSPAPVVVADGISFTPAALHLTRPDGEPAEFASVWLRDNRGADRDLVSGQRLVDIADLPANPRIRRVAVDGDAIAVEWEGEVEAARFRLGWLQDHSPMSAWLPPELRARRWLDGAQLASKRDFAWLASDALRSDDRRRLEWMTRLVQDGIAFLSGVPSTAHAILSAVAPLGFVIDTNYGRVFDVRSVPQPENLAYSDLGLGLHTDNPYRDPVPGFQALHCLITSREGGENLFADGFAIAEHLRATDAAAFDTLTRTPVPFRYRSKDAELFSEKPLIQLSSRGDIRAVHYNNRSVAPLRLDLATVQVFYDAYRRLAHLLREARFQMRTRLDDGDLVVFDNRRILHGRTAFSSARFTRHLQGCYLTRDSVLSETGVLRRRLEAGERT